MNAAMEFVNLVAPDHERNGCREDNPNLEARFAADDFGGCYRCTILRAMQLAIIAAQVANKPTGEGA